MAGYSGTPLVRKLGIKDGMRLTVLGAPDGYRAWLVGLPASVRLETRLPQQPSAVHVFSAKRASLAHTLARLRTTLDPDGFVWVSWPKKTSGVPTDITEDVVRAEALPLGFVDVKVCAVTDVWSGLKLVVRKSLRGPRQ